jgi:hypothetical protein
MLLNVKQKTNFNYRLQSKVGIKYNRKKNYEHTLSIELENVK